MCIWPWTPILQVFVETPREDLQYIKSFQNYSKLFIIFQDLSTFFESQLGLRITTRSECIDLSFSNKLRVK